MNVAEKLPYKGIRRVISAAQDTDDIINEVINAHYFFAKDYDAIAAEFDTTDRYKLAERLFNFCKKNISYRVESESHQTTRSAGALLRLGYGDCKHFAGFINGVIDAINRKFGDNIKFVYRFASYDITDPTPVHVFAVIKDNGREIWIDPVLKTLDQRSPAPQYFTDKKINPMLRTNFGNAWPRWFDDS